MRVGVDVCVAGVPRRYDRGGFSAGGNSRWAEESRDEEDWSKPTAPNERVEK